MASSAPLQSISITRIENRTLPSPHTVYAILVVLPVRSWTVYRRYSEFLALHQSLIDGSHGTDQPPAPLPPKNTTRKTIKAITGLGGLLSSSEIAKEAEEAQVRERKEGLERYLRAIVASTDSTWREADVFKKFIELPKSQSSLSIDSRPSTSPTGSRYKPGSYTNSSTRREINGRNTAAVNASSHLTTRTLGAKAPSKETETTRKLDERGLMASQQAQMDNQDSQLEDLAAILRRQKAMGLAINHELLEQTELLDNLDQEVNQTQDKMHGAERQMKKLGG
jgi:hypothetical protein